MVVGMAGGTINLRCPLCFGPLWQEPVMARYVCPRDRYEISHLNVKRWQSLRDFGLYLGKEGEEGYDFNTLPPDPSVLRTEPDWDQGRIFMRWKSGKEEVRSAGSWLVPGGTVVVPVEYRPAVRWDPGMPIEPYTLETLRFEWNGTATEDGIPIYEEV